MSSFTSPIPPGTPCGTAGCTHLAETKYFGKDSFAIGWIHSSPQILCMCCALKLSIAWAREMAGRLPGLQEKLGSVTCQESSMS